MHSLYVLLVSSIYLISFICGRPISPTPYPRETSPSVAVGTNSAGRKVLTVKGEPWLIRGVAYSPVPIAETVYSAPLGDYYTIEYAYIWQRDLAMMRDMGTNALRIYYWDTTKDHTAFLDAVSAAKMYVIPTFFIGDSYHYGHINSLALQQAKINEFVADVARYGDHPAILMWIFGNELNGFWMGLLDDFDVTACNGTWYPDGGKSAARQAFRGTPPCFYGGSVPTDPTCPARNMCVYGALFDWINAAIIAARQYTTRPITTAFSDVDNILAADYDINTGAWRSPPLDLAVTLSSRLPSMDIWSLNVYVGLKLADIIIRPFAQETNNNKLLLISEFGVDAYNDECGWNFSPICGNSVYGDKSGARKGGSATSPSFVGCSQGGDCSLSGEEAQTKWDQQLIGQVESLWSGNAGVANAVTVGSILMGWTDEYWKGIKVQAYCNTPCTATDAAGQIACLNDPFYTSTSGGSGCGTHDSYTHITCGQSDTTFHDICGYANGKTQINHNSSLDR
jgi:hypothetical protein